jgi:hypothetical protein
MTLKTEQSALYIVRQDDALTIVANASAGTARIAPVYLDGQRLDGVYSEVKPTSMDFAAAGNDVIMVPAGVDARDAFLLKMSAAAKSASKKQKAGVATIMLLSLAACGGNGGAAVEVKTAEIGSTGDRVSIVGASSGAIINVADKDDVLSGIVIDAAGEGELRIVFADNDGGDSIVLSADTNISGFTTIIVESGTVDFTNVTLPDSVTVIQVGSGAILTFDQFEGLDAVDLRATAEVGDLKVIVDDLVSARAVNTSAKIEDGISVEIDMSGNAGDLTIAELVELQGLVGEEDLSYSIVDDAENLFVFEGDVAVGFKDGVEALLDAADSITVSDAPVSVDASLLADLQDMGDRLQGIVFNLESTTSELDEGGAAVFTLTTINAEVGATYSYVLSGVANADVEAGVLTGNFVIGNDGKATVQVTLVADRVTEGAETLTLTVAGQSESVVVNDTSVNPTYTLTANAEAADEGQTAIFTLQTTNVDAGQSFDYVISGVSKDDVTSGTLTGTAVVGADGKAEISVQLSADRVTEGAETLTLTVAGQSESVVVTDTSVDPEHQFTTGTDNLLGNASFGNLFVGSVASDYSNDGEATTFGQNDLVDGNGGENTLRLNVEGGGDAVGVSVKNIQHLDVRMVTSGSDSTVAMQEWDDTLETVDIQGNDSIITLESLQAIPTVFVSNTGGEYTELELKFASGVLAGDADTISITVESLGNDYADIRLAAGIEKVNVDFADREDEATEMTLYADGAEEVVVTGGIAGQVAGIGARTADNSEFDATEFAGDLVFNSADVKTAHFGAGDDIVTLNGTADDSASSYDLGEGDNYANVRNTDFGGEITSSDGKDIVVIDNNVLATGSIDLAGGENEVSVGSHAGQINTGDDDDLVYAGSVAETGSIDVGAGDNTVVIGGDIGGDNAGSIEATDGNDWVIAGSNTGTINVGNGDNLILLASDIGGDSTEFGIVGGDQDGDITTGSGDDIIIVGSTALGSTIVAGDGDNIIISGTIIASESDTQAYFSDGADFPAFVYESGEDIHAGSITAGDGNDQIWVDAIYGGSINAGDGTNAIEVYGDMTDGTITVGNGSDNEINIGGSVRANTPTSIIVGNGDDNTLTIGGSLVGDDVVFGTGTGNAISVGSNVSGAIITVEGEATTLTVGNDVTNSTITLGDGVNDVNISDDVEDGSEITFGTGDDVLYVGDNVDGATIEMGDGANDVTIGDDVDSGSVMTFGAGDDTLVIGGDVSDATITMGEGANDVTIDSNVSDAVITFGAGDDTLHIGGSVFDVNIAMGDGDNELTVNGSVSDGAQITFGANNDTFALGTTDIESVISGYGVKTVVDLGAGDDTVIMTGMIGEDYDNIVRSGALVDGGSGDDDTLTVLAGQSIAQVVERTEYQRVALNIGTEPYNAGDEIIVTFSRGDELFSVTYTVVQPVEQGNDAVPAYDVLDGLIDAINNDVDASALFTAFDNGTAVRLHSFEYQEDFVISWELNGDALETVTQAISDTRIAGFETLELVAVHGTDTKDIEIGADFDLIDGTNTIILDSQQTTYASVPQTTLYGAADIAAGRSVIFNLDNLNGGEAITVKGNETTATGNTQVELITVGATEGNHEVGDQIVVTIGDVVVTYTVTEDDLAGGTAQLDANNIASSLHDAIDAELGDGVTVVVDYEDLNKLVIEGAAGESFAVTVDHLRAAVETLHEFDTAVLNGNLQDSYDLTPFVDGCEAGDVVTVTADGKTFSYTVTADDVDPACERMLAEIISEGLAAAADVAGVEGVTAAWGAVSYDGEFTLAATRDGFEDIGNTSVELKREATSVDDTDTDVIIKATLAPDATDTTMDLTLAGSGNFDLEISEATDFTDLNLTLGDEFSHYIDTYGDIGTFAETITVADADGVDTSGQNIELDYVLAHSVDTTGSAANFTIAQYVDDDAPVRADAVSDFSDETITVATGGGDDHLTTLAQSAIAEGSTIDLGAGRNELSLAWGASAAITSADLEDLGDIGYQGGLTQLNILNDVLLDQTATTLTMPGVVDNVEKITFTDVNEDIDSILNDVQNGPSLDAADLTIVGAANTFVIESGFDFDLGNSSFEDSVEAGMLTVQDAAGDEITGGLTVTTVRNAQFNIGNNALTGLTVEAEGRAEVFIVNNGSDATFNLGAVSITSGSDSANDDGLNILNNFDTSVTIASLVMDGNEDIDLDIDNNTDTSITIGDVTTVTGSDADIYLYYNVDTTINLGNVNLSNSGLRSDRDDDFLFNIEGNDNVVVTVASVALTNVSGDDARFYVSDNENSSVTVSGDINLFGDRSGELIVSVNSDTDVSLADGGTINLTACDSGASVLIYENINSSDAAMPDGVSNVDVTITLGDINLSAGNTARLEFSDNIDQSYDSDMIIEVGNVTMASYGSAYLNIGSEEQNDDEGNDAVTIIVGDVDMASIFDSELNIRENYGRIYEDPRQLNNSSDYVIDYVDITVGNVDVVTEEDFYAEISDNRLATISVGDVTVNAAGEAQFNISDNDVSGEDTDFTSVTDEMSISVGHVSMTAGDRALFSISDNDTDFSSFGSIDISVASVTLVSNGVGANDRAEFNLSYNSTGFSNGDMTFTVDSDDLSDGDFAISLTSASDANFEIYGNDASDGGGDITITVGDMFIDAGREALLDITSNDASDNTDVDITVGDLDATSSERLRMEIIDNSGTEDGDMTITVGAVSVVSENDEVVFRIEENRASDSGSVEINIASDADVRVLVDADTDAQLLIKSNSVEGSNWSDANTDLTITLGDVDVRAGDDGNVVISKNDAVGNSDDVTLAITLGDVTIGASDDLVGFDALFQISDNDAFVADEGEYDYQTTRVNVNVGTVAMYAARDVTFEIFGNDAQNTASSIYYDYSRVQIGVGSVTIAASDDVNFYVSDNFADDYNSSVGVTLGDVNIDAGVDVDFVLHDNYSSSVTAGNIDIVSGLQTNSEGDDSSHVYFYATGFGGTETITIDAQSAEGGTGSIFAHMVNGYDVTTVTLSGSDAELRMEGDFTDTSADVFTIDLSGMTGAFDDGAENYNPKGFVSGSKYDSVDAGVYVANFNAYLGDDVLVKIGSSDLIYNAQSSEFDGGVDWGMDYAGENAVNDWYGDEGWYSLGAELDLSPTIAYQEFTVSGLSALGFSDGDQSWTQSVLFETGDHEFAIVIEYDWDSDGDDWFIDDTVWYELNGASWTVRSEQYVELAMGANIVVDYAQDGSGSVGSSTVTFTGDVDGSDFDYIQSARRDGGDGDDRFTEALTGQASAIRSAQSFNVTGVNSGNSFNDPEVRSVIFEAGGDLYSIAITYEYDFGGEESYLGSDWSFSINGNGVSKAQVEEALDAFVSVELGSYGDPTTVSFSGGDGNYDFEKIVDAYRGGVEYGTNVTVSTGDEPSIRGVRATDGNGNDASETFLFGANALDENGNLDPTVTLDIGEIVIGGFRPNGFFEQSEVDRLDFSLFDDIRSGADLIITLEEGGRDGDANGYFNDIIIDFVNDEYGDIRLVGAGEYFTAENVNGITNNIIFTPEVI